MDVAMAPERLRAWVDDVAALTKPQAVYWCDGSRREIEELYGRMVAEGSLIRLDPVEASRLLLRTEPRQRRRAGRGPDVHLLSRSRQCRADKQLARPGRDARRARAHSGRLHAGPHALRDPLSDGAAQESHGAGRRRADRQPLRRRQHADHDAHGTGRAGGARRDGRIREGHPQHRHARSGQPLHQPFPRRESRHQRQLELRRQRALGEEMFRAAAGQRDGPKGGMAGRAHADHRHHRAERPQDLYRGRFSVGLRENQSCHARAARRPIAKRAGTSKRWETTSPGSSSDPMAGSTASIRKPDSSASPPARAWRPIRTPCSPAAPTRSSPTSPCCRDNTVWWEGMDGPAPATAFDWKGQPVDARIQDAGRPSEQPLHGARRRSALRSRPTGKSPRGCRSTPSSSAAAAPRPFRLSTRRFTGGTGPSSAPR